MGRLPAIAGLAVGLGILSAVGVALVGLNFYDEGATTPWWFDVWGVLTWCVLGAGLLGLLVTVAIVVLEAVRRR